MNITQRLALDAGFPLEKPEVLCHYYPLPFDNYIVLQADAKFQSRKYSYWAEVINILLPVLEKRGIKIVNIGLPGEIQLQNVENLVGKTTINQVAYLIKNAKLVVSPDSLSCHLAGVFDIPLVGLYSNMFVEQSRPYWGDRNKQILIQADRKGLKPTYAVDEAPKTIDNIKPEEIARAIFKLLNIDTTINYETLWIGPHYNSTRIENVPDQVINLDGLGVDSLIIRMDFLHNEDNLVEQLKVCKCSIICNQPINPEIIRLYRNQIIEIIYEITPKHSIEFVDLLQRSGINYLLFSYEPKQFLDTIKLDYFDYKLINPKQKTERKDVPEVCLKPTSSLAFKSRKFTLSRGKIYLSKAHWLADRNIPKFDMNVGKAIDSAEFWAESENFYFLEDKNPVKAFDFSSITF